MTLAMPFTNLLDKIPFLKNGPALLGVVFLLAGVTVAWEGMGMLRSLWVLLKPYFSLSHHHLPDDVSERVLTSIPFILQTFVATVGSIAAVLMGMVWSLSGLADVIRSREPGVAVGELDRPGVVAESLRQGQMLYWRTASVLWRLGGSVFPWLRYISPVSIRVFRDVVHAAIKLVVVAVVLILLFYGLRILPDLLRQHLQISVQLAVPSPRPLLSLLGLVMVLDCLIAATFLRVRRPQFFRAREVFAVQGKGEPHLFLALVEESCRLLSGPQLPVRSPVRLGHDEHATVKGTLVEQFADEVRFFGRPAGYLCLPLVYFFITMGFSRLVHFKGGTTPVAWQELVSFHLLGYVLDAAIALALIMCGTHLAEWARKAFAMRTFRSTLVFCQVAEGRGGQPIASPDASSFTLGTLPVPWKVVTAVDEIFISWARNPESSLCFQVELFAAETLSEALEEGGTRFVIRMDVTAGLAETMERIVLLPFYVNFETAPTDDSGASRDIAHLDASR